jgi:glycosyltransferase involved in cell wall biosynthesis
VFSVIIPTRNRPVYLRQAVESVLAQTVRPQEIIVVNDGDGRIAGLEDLPVTIADNARAGPVAARQCGVEAASGAIIAFLDDDDLWSSPRHLEVAAAEFASGAMFTFADGELAFEPGSEAVPSALPYKLDADAKSLECDNTILISAVCYRRALHDTIGPFDVSLPYYWDWDWYLRVARSGAKLEHVRVPTVTIRVHRGNMSGETMRAERQANLEILARKHGLAVPGLKNHVSLALERGG